MMGGCQTREKSEHNSTTHRRSDSYEKFEDVIVDVKVDNDVIDRLHDETLHHHEDQGTPLEFDDAYGHEPSQLHWMASLAGLLALPGGLLAMALQSPDYEQSELSITSDVDVPSQNDDGGEVVENNSGSITTPLINTGVDSADGGDELETIVVVASGNQGADVNNKDGVSVTNFVQMPSTLDERPIMDLSVLNTRSVHVMDEMEEANHSEYDSSQLSDHMRKAGVWTLSSLSLSTNIHEIVRLRRQHYVEKVVEYDFYNRFTDILTRVDSVNTHSTKCMLSVPSRVLSGARNEWHTQYMSSWLMKPRRFSAHDPTLSKEFREFNDRKWNTDFQRYVDDIVTSVSMSAVTAGVANMGTLLQEFLRDVRGGLSELIRGGGDKLQSMDEHNIDGALWTLPQYAHVQHCFRHYRHGRVVFTEFCEALVEGEDASEVCRSVHKCWANYVRACRTMANAHVPHAHLRLNSLVTCCGRTLFVSVDTPTQHHDDASTLVEGSKDGGFSVVHRSQVACAMNQFTSKRLGACSHQVEDGGHSRSVYSVWSSIHTQTHYCGEDCRYYLENLWCAVPNQPPRLSTEGGTARTGTYDALYRLFRPEFLMCARTNVPLAPDAFTYHHQAQSQSHEINSLSAYATLFHSVIPSLATHLHTVYDSQPSLASTFHKFGVNMRYLGAVYECAKQSHVKQWLMEEMVIRCVKHTYRQWVCDAVHEHSTPNCHVDVWCHILELLFSKSTEFWRHIHEDMHVCYGVAADDATNDVCTLCCSISDDIVASPELSQFVGRLFRAVDMRGDAAAVASLMRGDDVSRHITCSGWKFRMWSAQVNDASSVDCSQWTLSGRRLRLQRVIESVARNATSTSTLLPHLHDLLDTYKLEGSTEGGDMVVRRILAIRSVHFDYFSLARVADFYKRTKRYHDSLRFYTLHLTQCEQLDDGNGTSFLDVGSCLTSIGGVYGALGDNVHQYESLQKAYQLYNHRCKSDNWHILSALHNLSLACMACGKYQQQAAMLERAIVVHCKLAKSGVRIGNFNGAECTDEHKEHMTRLAAYLSALSTAYGALGLTDKRLNCSQRALSLYKGLYGAESINYALALAKLGSVYGELRRYHEQVVMLEHALAIANASDNAVSGDVVRMLNIVSDAYRKLGMKDKYMASMEDALRLSRELYGELHPEVARCMHNLAIGYGDMLGDQQRKVELLQQALTIKERTLGPQHVEVAITLANLGVAMGHNGHPHKMRNLLVRAQQIASSKLGGDHSFLMFVRQQLSKADVLLNMYQMGVPEDVALRHSLSPASGGRSAAMTPTESIASSTAVPPPTSSLQELPAMNGHWSNGGDQVSPFTTDDEMDVVEDEDDNCKRTTAPSADSMSSPDVPAAKSVAQEQSTPLLINSLH